MRISLRCDALAEMFNVADSRTQIVGTDIFRSLAHLATETPDHYDLLLSELTKYGECSLLAPHLSSTYDTTYKINIDDFRAQLLITDIVALLDRMLKSSNEDMQASGIRLLWELARYSAHFALV